MQSQHDMITKSLHACGASVGVVLTVDSRGCANSTLLDRLASWHGKHLQKSGAVIARTQGQNVRGALQLFMPIAHEYDAMILTRYDLRLLVPFTAWPGCQGISTIGVASRCEMQQWRNWNCTNDILFVVPRAHLWAFNASAGAEIRPTDSRYFSAPRGRAKINPSACFARAGEVVSHGVPKGLGHGCYNSLAQHVGHEQLSFCWPSASGVTEPNEFYQCCRHGTMQGTFLSDDVHPGNRSVTNAHARHSSLITLAPSR